VPQGDKKTTVITSAQTKTGKKAKKEHIKLKLSNQQETKWS